MKETIERYDFLLNAFYSQTMKEIEYKELLSIERYLIAENKITIPSERAILYRNERRKKQKKSRTFEENQQILKKDKDSWLCDICDYLNYSTSYICEGCKD